MHVRGFSDGRLEAEIEISRDYIEHLDDKYCRDATPELKQILDIHQVPYQARGNLPKMTFTLEPPGKLTPWKPIVAIVAIGAFLIWLSRRK